MSPFVKKNTGSSIVCFDAVALAGLADGLTPERPMDNRSFMATAMGVLTNFGRSESCKTCASSKLSASSNVSRLRICWDTDAIEEANASLSPSVPVRPAWART